MAPERPAPGGDMIWVYLYGQDGRLLLVCPAVDALMWGFLEGTHWFRFALIGSSADPGDVSAGAGDGRIGNGNGHLSGAEHRESARRVESQGQVDSPLKS